MTTSPRKNLLGKIIQTPKDAEKDIASTAAVLGIFGLLTATVGSLIEPMIIYDGAFVFLFALMLYWLNSRVAAIMLLLHTGANVLDAAATLRSGGIFSLVGFWLSLRAVQATFAWHKFAKADPSLRTAWKKKLSFKCTSCGLILNATDKDCYNCGTKTAFDLPVVTSGLPIISVSPAVEIDVRDRKKEYRRGLRWIFGPIVALFCALSIRVAVAFFSTTDVSDLPGVMLLNLLGLVCTFSVLVGIPVGVWILVRARFK